MVSSFFLQMAPQDEFTDKRLIDAVLNAIKSDDVDTLDSEIKQGIPKDINFPPELPEEPPLLRNGSPFICMAAYFGSMKCLEYLFSHGWDKQNTDDDGMTVSFFASAAGKIDVIKYLISQKVDVQGCGQASLRHHQLDTFKQLIELNIIQINDLDFLHSTYLHIAAFECYTEAVEFILTIPNVNINATDRDGRTPLHLAAGNGGYDVCKLLLDTKKANAFLKDNFGRIPLYYAVAQGEMKVIELFLGGEVNGIQRDGKTPLMRACAEGRIDLAEIILDVPGVDINAQNEDGLTALHWAVKCEKEHSVALLINTPNINLNIQDKEGETALHLASMKEEMGIVQMLLKKGANHQIKNNKGQTVIEAIDANLQPQEKKQ